jgi:RNA polymerase sigma-70 factor (ECF subfamily)
MPSERGLHRAVAFGSPSPHLVRHRYDEGRRGKVTVRESDWLATRFEENRAHLRAVAYRMLGSRCEADDAVQEAWLHFARSETAGIANPDGWLTSVVALVCLDMLRARKARGEESQGAHLLRAVRPEGRESPEDESALADSVGLALLVVLDTLTPPERLAFVLHDLFDMPFDQIAPIVGRSLVAAKKLASRARRRVRGPTARSSARLPRQGEVVEAFLAAVRGGDLDALLAVLDPDAVVRADALVVRGARDVAKNALIFSRGAARFARPALVNGAAGLVVAPNGRLTTALAFEIEGEKIVRIDVFRDPARLHELELSLPGGWP